MNDLFLPGGQGPLQQFTYKDHSSSLTAYQTCPPFAAVLNKLAKNYVNGKTWLMDDKGKQSESNYGKKIRKLLAKPNPLQTWSQFEAQQDIFINLYGWCPCLPILPFGFKNIEDATSIWNIPTNICYPKETNKLWYQTDISGIIEEIKISYGGQITQLPLEKIFIFRDITPGICSQVFPSSRVEALELPINNIIGAYKSRNVLINYRGALGIISSESDKNGYIPIKPSDKEALQEDFKRYGLLHQQWKFIITSAAVKWQQIGVATRDLMLFEEIQDDIYRVCDQYDFPSPLMSSDKNNALGGSNQDPAMSSLYQNAIIPTSIGRYEQWNIFLKCRENNCVLEKDYSQVPALQEDDQKKAQARKTRNDALLIEFKMNLLKVNRWLELNGEDTLGPEGDVYYTDWVAAGKNFGEIINQNQNGNNQNPSGT
jgi:hypothetical protein